MRTDKGMQVDDSDVKFIGVPVLLSANQRTETVLYRQDVEIMADYFTGSRVDNNISGLATVLIFLPLSIAPNGTLQQTDGVLYDAEW